MGAVPVSIAPIHGSKVTEMFLCHIINDQQIPQAFRSFHFEVATCAGEKRNGKLDTVPRSTPESWNICIYFCHDPVHRITWHQSLVALVRRNDFE